jgi:cytoplasmic iron level regulating protein YaaA (DUF328/UPF0246 family)
MIILLSPAKTLDYETPCSAKTATNPRMLKKSAELVDCLKKYSPKKITALMGVSDKIAELNVERYNQWQVPFTKKNSKQAIYAFRGDVYNGFDVDTLKGKEIDFAQKHLRVLSGLYGLLRPLDLMQPYRLEMGTKLNVSQKNKNLYQFWDTDITDLINEDLDHHKKRLVINLASNEYFKSVKPKLLDSDVITPGFKDLKGGKYKVVSFWAKVARGQMARYIVQKQLKNIQHLKNYDVDGYRFNESLSDLDTQQWIFTRDH